MSISFNSSNSSIADIYDERYSDLTPAIVQQQRLRDKKIMQRCFQYLPQKYYESIVDLGCGTGSKTFWLADYAEDVIGVDISSHGIALAQLYNSRPGVTFMTGDVTQLTSVPKADCITSFGLSVTNVNSVGSMVETILNFLTRFGRANATYLYYSKTDLSGDNPGWKYHSLKEIHQFVQLIRNAGYQTSIIFFLSNGIDLYWERPVHRFLLFALTRANKYLRQRRLRIPLIAVINYE